MKKLMVLGAVIIILAAAAFIPVFGTAEGDDFYLRYKDKNIYVLNYEQTTGAGYTVKNTKDEKLFGKSVAVKTLFDPRFLKDNKDFLIDSNGEYIVISGRVGKTEIDGEAVDLIYADRIIIKYDGAPKSYHIYDMMPQGIIKAIMPGHLSY